MNIAELLERVPGRKARKRLGRGPGSGLGKTAGRGHKGAHSRSGWKKRFGYAGGQTPITRRFPKRGFNNKWRVEVEVVNVGRLSVFEEGTEISPELLKQRGLISDVRVPLKILGDGDLSAKLTVKAHRFSKSAAEKITAAGGTVVKL